MFENFKKQFKNAREIVQQIRDGRWQVGKDMSTYSRRPYRMYSKDGMYSLWVTSGPFFLKLKREEEHPQYDRYHDDESYDYFGLFWRHYVWHFAVRQFLEKHRKQIGIPDVIVKK